jgi:hypothetical protein
MITKDSSIRGDVFNGFWDDTILCNNFARWLQKIASCDMLVLWDDAIFFNNFMLPKRRFSMTERTFRNAFSKYFFKCEYSIWATCIWNYFENAFLNVRSDFQNLRLGSINFARLLQKMVSCDAMCWVFWDDTIFCNNFARWLQKMASWDVLVSWMLWSFVTTLQDDYKRS